VRFKAAFDGFELLEKIISKVKLFRVLCVAVLFR